MKSYENQKDLWGLSLFIYLSIYTSAKELNSDGNVLGMGKEGQRMDHRSAL